MLEIINNLIIKNAYAAKECGETKGWNCSTDVAQIGSIENIFSSIISAAGILFGFGFFLMIIWGGIKFLTSGGDPKAVASAKATLTWAIIGLAILALSYTILVIITAFTGVDVTKFKITGY